MCRFLEHVLLEVSHASVVKQGGRATSHALAHVHHRRAKGMCREDSLLRGLGNEVRLEIGHGAALHFLNRKKGTTMTF